MGKINMSRVVLGGIAAGVVLFILDGIVNGFLLADQWAQAMSAIGKPAAFGSSQMIGFGLLDIGVGIALVWLYAAMRPRFGAGPATALRAGAIAWVVGVLLTNVGFMVAGILPTGLLGASTIAGIVQVAAAALTGAALYKEEATSSARASAAGA